MLRVVPIFEPGPKIKRKEILDISKFWTSKEHHMTVVRYEPWALVNRLQKDIDRLFSAPQTTAADTGAWLPPVDIHEEEGQFVVNVDLPGVDPMAANGEHSLLGIASRAASSASVASFSGASRCRKPRTSRTSRQKPSTVCWKSRSRNLRRCSRIGSRSRLRKAHRSNGFLRVRSPHDHPCGHAARVGRSRPTLIFVIQEDRV
jgi:hypothetical protein